MTEAPELSIRSAALPALHGAASDVSLKAQKTYLRLVRANLVLLAIGALLSAVSFGQEGQEDVVRSVAAIGVLTLVAALVVTAVISLRNFERRWYGGRAMAESVKTLAWRYVTCAEPFARGLHEKDADTLFIEQLRAVLDESDALQMDFGGVAGTKDQITDSMREVRAASLEDRKDVYLRDRVRNQREWYSGKAGTNSRREGVFFAAIWLVQLGAVAAGLYVVLEPASTFNWTGLLTTIAAGLLAWLQVRRHQELSQSYSIAALELGLIAEAARHASTEDDFSQFVADAESAISREHTLWVARRDVPGRLQQGLS